MPNTYRDPDAAERPLAFETHAAPPRGPAPITLILSLLVLAGVGGGVFYLYRDGVRPPDGPPEPVGVPLRDVRVVAPPQPQAPDPAAGLSIYKDDPNAAGAAPTFTPPPEQPDPRPSSVPRPPALVAAAPVVAAPDSAPPGAVQPARPNAIPATGAEPVIANTAAQPNSAAKPAKPAKASTIDALLANSSPAPVKRPLTATGFVVQIGAFSSQALADKSWNSAAGLAPGSMAGKGKRVAQITKPGGATLYRTDITGFETREAAQSMCAKLITAGRTCFVR